MDTGPLLAGTRWLALTLGGCALVFAGLLFVLPARFIARAKRQLEADLDARVLSFQEEDRRRIARELHDGVGQALTAARLRLASLRDTDRDPVAIELVMQHIDEAMGDVRRSTTALSPPVLAELGLIGALRQHCETFARAANLSVQCEILEPLPPLDAHVETACYRIAQEALHNTARHAGAACAWVRVEASHGMLRMDIGDDGAGFVPKAQESERGLTSIRQRARLVGGVVQIAPGDPTGVRLTVSLPVAQVDE